jgi:nucleotide-binding universal stress UspA family protein
MPATPVVDRADFVDLAPASRGTRRERPRLLVAVDGSVAAQHRLVWALQEAARREGVVLAVAVIGTDEPAATRIATRTALQAQVLVAEEQAGVRGRSVTALLEPHVFDALAGTARGSDLVVVGAGRSVVLRPAVPLPPARRPLTRCP